MSILHSKYYYTLLHCIVLHCTEHHPNTLNGNILCMNVLKVTVVLDSTEVHCSELLVYCSVLDDMHCCKLVV